MGFGLPLASVISENRFTGNAQGANVEALVSSIGQVDRYILIPNAQVRFDIGIMVTLISNATARTLRLRLRIGGLTGAVLVDTGALALPVSTALTASPAMLFGHWTQRTVGASGIAGANAMMPNRFYSLAKDNTHPFSMAFAPTTFDTTIDQQLVLTAQESVNTVADQVNVESAILQLFKY